jgi:hypothetical protein
VTLKIILENDLFSLVMKYYTPILRKKHTISKCDPALVETVKSSREGKIWGSTKKIPVILSEHPNE